LFVQAVAEQVVHRRSEGVVIMSPEYVWASRP